ncbi:hypothetical protein P3T22_000029 [Paraburkholderia sp. GAS348]
MALNGSCGDRDRQQGRKSSGTWFVVGFGGEAGAIYTADSLGLLGAELKRTAAIRPSVDSGSSIDFAAVLTGLKL